MRKKRNVGVILYVNHRALEQQIDEVLPVYERWGDRRTQVRFHACWVGPMDALAP